MQRAVAKGELRRLVQVDLSVGRRTIFEDHANELAGRARSDGAVEIAARFEALAAGGERTVSLDPEHEAAVLAAIDGWMSDAQELPVDVLALRHALRRQGV